MFYLIYYFRLLFQIVLYRIKKLYFLNTGFYFSIRFLFSIQIDPFQIPKYFSAICDLNNFNQGRAIKSLGDSCKKVEECEMREGIDAIQILLLLTLVRRVSAISREIQLSLNVQICRNYSECLHLVYNLRKERILYSLR